MLNDIEKYFELRPGMEDWILKSIGTKWRNWKKDLKFDYFDPSLPFNDLVKERDERVNEHQWKDLILHWMSDKGKKASIRGQKARKHKKANQNTGRKSFAQIRKDLENILEREPTRVETYKECFPVEKEGATKQIMGTMQELIDKLSDPSQDVVGINDVYATANGGDKPGRVAMMGLGVTPQDVFEMVPSRKTLNRMLKENIVETQRLRQQVETYKNHADPSSDERINSPHVSSPSPDQHIESAQASLNLVLPLEINCSVLILSVTDPSKIVAKGYVCSMDPTTLVGGEELGKNWCSVHLTVAVERDGRLIRIVFMTQTIGEAIGAFVAWPSNLVVRC